MASAEYVGMLLTAFATLETAADAFDTLAFDFFIRPVRVKELVACAGRAPKASKPNQEEHPDG